MKSTGTKFCPNFYLAMFQVCAKFGVYTHHGLEDAVLQVSDFIPFPSLHIAAHVENGQNLANPLTF
jgi:hypothetical protein